MPPTMRPMRPAPCRRRGTKGGRPSSIGASGGPGHESGRSGPSPRSSRSRRRPPCARRARAWDRWPHPPATSTGSPGARTSLAHGATAPPEACAGRGGSQAEAPDGPRRREHCGHGVGWREAKCPAGQEGSPCHATGGPSHRRLAFILSSLPTAAIAEDVDGVCDLEISSNRAPTLIDNVVVEAYSGSAGIVPVGRGFPTGGDPQTRSGRVQFDLFVNGLPRESTSYPIAPDGSVDAERSVLMRFQSFFWHDPAGTPGEVRATYLGGGSPARTRST